MRGGLERWKRGVGSQGVRQALAYALNRAQLHLHARLQAQKARTGKVRALVLKARQQGFSTYVQARFFWLTAHGKGTQAFILAHSQDAVDNLFAMAATTGAVPSRHFDLMFDATCGNDEVRAFLLDANPEAAGAVARRFEEAARRGLWTTRRNSSAAMLQDMLENAR